MFATVQDITCAKSRVADEARILTEAVTAFLTMPNDEAELGLVKQAKVYRHWWMYLKSLID